MLSVTRFVSKATSRTSNTARFHMNGNATLARPESGKIALPNGILILGAAKSGTTGLFYAIQNALSVEHNVTVSGLFEPRRSGDVILYRRTSSDQVHLVK